jgi:cytochrome d ubiquinol oxidase subunit II
MAESDVLTNVWAAILAFAVFMYVVMDGFDLGIGILFPCFGVGRERDTAMNSIAPVWDGNETWLVLGGGGLLAAFPLAYAVVMSALYAPLIAMLLALVFRGVAFEFRWRDPAHRAFWDIAFSGGSLVAALMQGIMLGALLQGVQVEGRAYAGGWWDWLTPFSLLTGASVVAASCSTVCDVNGTHRICFTTSKLLPRSASDWMSPLPTNGSPAGAPPYSHLSSNSRT